MSVQAAIRGTAVPSGLPAGATAEALARQAAAGSEAAFESLVRGYERRVHGFAYRYVRDPYEAQDLAQEIFLRLYSRLPTFQPERPFEPWFWRLAAHVCLNYVRRRASRPAVRDGADPGQLPAPETAEETAFSSALGSLAPRERLLLLLYYHAGMPIDEIAASLGVGLPALRSRMHRARVQLRRALAEAG